MVVLRPTLMRGVAPLLARHPSLLRPASTRLMSGGPRTPTGFVQDGPPEGGYPAVDVRRSLPGGGMSTLAALATIGGMFVFGMYKIINANYHRRCVAARSNSDPLGILFPSLARVVGALSLTRTRCRTLAPQGFPARGVRHPDVDRALSPD